MTTTIASLVAGNLDLWTSATQRKSGAGRGGGKRISLYGIERLCALILDLAVRGKLVPQDAGDEPAAELLKRIERQKKISAAIGDIRNPKKLETITSDECPFPIPSDWKWVRLGTVCLKITDGTHHSPENLSVGDYKYISAKNIKPWGIDDKELTYVSAQNHEEIYSRCNPELGDILYIKDGATTGIGTINPLKEPFSMLSSVALLKPSDGLFNEYALKCITAPSFYNQMRAEMTGVAITRVTLKKLENALIPLPPLAEQRRIVAKVDELMAHCDALERESADAMAAHQALVEALLATLVSSADTAELATNWVRLEQHFDTLFTTEVSIDALKQTILDLAVRGKLMEQDAGDWPVRPLGVYVKDASAGWSPKCIETPRSGERWGVLKVSAVTWGHYQPDENKELPSGLEPRPEIEVKPRDFLISRANTAELVARSVVVPADAPAKLMMSDKIIRLRFNDMIDPEYVNLVHAAPLARAYYARVAGGTSSSMKNVSQSQIRALEIPIPPLAEQHRIVAKVDALMALCDALKARITDAATTQKHLADAIVERAAA